MLTAEQLRAARALIRWDQSDIASRAGVSPETIKRLERMDGPLLATKAATLQALRSAFEAAGVEFIPANGGGPGVRLRHAGSPASAMSGHDQGNG
ncbi:helix-turn-helix domain-containing protein [Methylobacterium sp. J-043]|nr:helix-turn-helix domain-containing protein [Methylobacterium sp. J-043]